MPQICSDINKPNGQFCLVDAYAHAHKAAWDTLTNTAPADTHVSTDQRAAAADTRAGTVECASPSTSHAAAASCLQADGSNAKAAEREKEDGSMLVGAKSEREEREKEETCEGEDWGVSEEGDRWRDDEASGSGRDVREDDAAVGQSRRQTILAFVGTLPVRKVSVCCLLLFCLLKMLICAQVVELLLQ